jgi:uracil-DNA glycosylase family protein
MTGGAAAFLPEKGGLAALRSAAAGCRGCELYRDATQTVFGEGRARARVVMVGEQPGDREDVAGAPFVGPAGRLLDKVLVEADVDRAAVYLTNAVKHFSFRLDERGKRRIHQRPRSGQVAACRPWLAAELEVVRPELVVCLGATAATAVAGSSFRLTDHRGQLVSRPDSVADDLPGEWKFLVTVHPSSVLRAPDRERAYQDLLADLLPVAKFLAS